MTQTENSPTPPALSRPARLAWLLLILATLYICYFHNLGAIGLVGPDEPRYAWIARAMIETGDWVTPRLYGNPWFEKPVLYYWGAALSFKLFGVSEVTARLPSALSALLATLALAWLALRLYGAETARWLLLLLPSTVGMIGFSHAAATDMPFAAMLTIAMVFAARLLGLVPNPLAFSSTSSSLTSSTSFNSILFGLFLGLSVLAKGPAAIILSGGAVLLWAIFTKRWRDAFRCLHPVAILSFCLIALPWYILCARRNPDFFRIFIIEHNFKRYLTPEFQHIQPFWFYIPILLIAFVPWTLALFWSFVVGLKRLRTRAQLSPATVFLFVWPLFCLAFFCISKSKLPGYILPAIPAIGLLMTNSLVHVPESAQRGFRWWIVAWSAVAIPASVVLLWIGKHHHESRTTAGAMLVVGSALLLFSWSNLLLAIKPRPRFALDLTALCVVPVLLIVLMFHTFSRPWLHWDPSGKALATEIQEKRIPLDQIYVAKMPRGQQFSLDFYLHYEVATWSVDNPKNGYLLLNSNLCAYYVKPPWVCEASPIPLDAERNSTIAVPGWFLYRVSAGGL